MIKSRFNLANLSGLHWAIALRMKLTEVGSKLTNLKENKISSNQVNSQTMKLEVVVLPVADVDQTKDFYKTLGWRT